MPSVLPIMQTALYDALSAATAPGGALEGVHVSFGPPADPMPAEYVAVGWQVGEEPFGGESQRDFASFPVSNPIAISERFSIRLVVQSLGGPELRPAYERGAELADAVESVLGQDVTFAGVALHGLAVKRRETAYRTDNSRGALVTLEVAGEARRSIT